MMGRLVTPEPPFQHAVVIREGTAGSFRPAAAKVTVREDSPGWPLSTLSESIALAIDWRLLTLCSARLKSP
jgi:hypothetical protein